MADTRFFLGNLRKKPTVQPPLGYAEVAPNKGCSLLPLGKKTSDDAKIVILRHLRLFSRPTIQRSPLSGGHEGEKHGHSKILPGFY